tara:strand:+ start:310 stop:987 length:678 start_codon:yes stop_codon:yes gene_type:complete
MATGQTILDLMEGLDASLQIQDGESGVRKGLIAANAAQDYLESILALEPNNYGSTFATVTTTADTESTTFPSGLLRLDRLQYINPSTSRPIWDLEFVGYTGDQYGPASTYPSLQFDASTTGKPRRYWTNGSVILWDPVPDAVHTVRYYGLVAKSDITASGTFDFPDIAMTPVAQYAVELLKVGTDDAVDSISAFGQKTFEPFLRWAGRFNRDRAPGYDYRYYHSV